MDNGGLDLLAAASREPGPQIDGSLQHQQQQQQQPQLQTSQQGQQQQIPPPLPQPRRADQPRMRSSIACARCRRSKVKCLNNGINTACRACVVSGRECIYPAPASSDRSHRRDDSFARSGDSLLSTPDGSRSAKAKSRKSLNVPFGTPTSTRAPIDALSSSVLTTQVWLELFDIWQQNFAIDLPFLHSTSFTRSLRETRPAPSQQDFNSSQNASSENIPAIAPELLLAFLTLTSRFHPSIVTHHSSTRPGNPLVAPEYYASVCRERLATISNSPPDLSRVQALLMLAVHEWGDCQGSRAWSHLQDAIKYAKLLGYSHSSGTVSEQSIVQPVSTRTTRPANLHEDSVQDEETRRRTFWACFILERNLSSGTYRPLSFNSRTITLPLPASEKSYLFNEKVHTQILVDWLDEADARNGAANSSGSRRREQHDDQISEVGAAEGALSRYVKASEIYNTVLQWAGNGGRLNETHAPWDNQSDWQKLYHSVDRLTGKLPRELALTPANISAHLMTRSAASFTLLHTSLLLSKILLLREFLPFMPLNVTHPSGPLDRISPFLQSTTAESAGSFWEDSAAEVFKAAHDLLGLYTACSERKLLVETPLVGYAAFVIAGLSVYSTHFPWMDSRQYLCSAAPARGSGVDAEAARKAADIVSSMKPRLRLADGWFKSLGRLHHYYARTKRDLARSMKQEARQAKQHLPSIRTSNEAQPQLDHVLGADQTYSADTEMVDAPSSVTNTSSQVDRGKAESVARETWAAVNAPSQNQEATNGVGYTPGRQQSPGIRSNYPPISPQAPSQPYSPANLPQFPYNSPYSQQTRSPHASSAAIETAQEARPSATAAPSSSSTAAPEQSWNVEQLDSWLESLPTVFGANDLVAFAEAVDWTDFAAPESSVGGWLRLIWTK